MISALQHYVYCPRQCGLIHVDDVWQENVFTVRGNILHGKVDTDTYETRGNTKTVRGLRIHSYKFGITGRCDVVEFKETENGKIVLPVEFKSGEPKEDISDKVQLCAQAICLEEMLNITIKQGAFFYGKIRRRNIVDIDEELRTQTENIILAVRQIVASKKIPIAEFQTKCRNCSLQSICQPKAMNKRKLENYIKDLYSV
ncbi:MAG TPA: CRISPR-associated protein Cas4 [Ignavibacteriaceae bacterium]|nr:CRISPR-associated protein Cas4 [Ignavibacteriaceae bacterium]HRQ55674.1 CRISPR-associated protein Cas4 [Ignavibacteriaceae bacterium]